MDQIQFLFRDINTGHFIESGRYGGNGGRPWAYQAPPGQWIDKIWVGTSNYVTSIKFGTNQGTMSNEYGRHGQRTHYFDVSGRRIAGTTVRAGALIDALQFLAF